MATVEEIKSFITPGMTPQDVISAANKYNVSLNDLGAAYGYTPAQSLDWYKANIATGTPEVPALNPVSPIASAPVVNPTPSYIAQQVKVPEIKPFGESPQAYISPESRITNQLTSLLSSDSPLLKLAQSRSQEQANKAGMLGSTMAAGAGTRAVIQEAVPIASAEATRYANRDLSQQTYDQNLNTIVTQGGIASSLQAQQDAAAMTRLQTQIASDQYIMSQQFNNDMSKLGVTIAADADAATRKTTADLLNNSIILKNDITNNPNITAEDKLKGYKIIENDTGNSINTYLSMDKAYVAPWGATNPVTGASTVATATKAATPVATPAKPTSIIGTKAPYLGATTVVDGVTYRGSMAPVGTGGGFVWTKVAGE